MKIAFSTASVPDWGIDAALERARGMGFDGIELGAVPLDAAEVGRAARESGVGIACLCTPATYIGRRGEDQVAGGVIESAIDATGAMGCRYVRLLDPARGADFLKFGEFLRPLADHASQHGVMLLVENARTWRTARPLWTLLDTLDHPAIGICWNLRVATLAGESPYVSVPLLNTRIRHVHLEDGGELPIQTLLNRLRGIGYEGTISVVSDDPAELLKRLRDWTRPAVAGKGVKAAVVKSG